MEFSDRDKCTLFSIIRQAIYFVLCVAFMFGIIAVTRHFGAEVFDENRLIENLQLLLLLASGLVFFTKACLCRRHSTVLALCAALAMFGACRECDNILDKLLPIISWRIGLLFMLATVIYTIKNFKNFMPALLEFANTPAFFLMCSAITIVGPIAQLIGHRPLLQAALPAHQDIGQIKELFEECAESAGYFILFLASIETCLCLHKHKKCSPP